MKIGVIGAGWWGTNIINTLENLVEVTDIAVFDSNNEVYNKFKKNRKVLFFNEINSLIKAIRNLSGIEKIE